MVGVRWNIVFVCGTDQFSPKKISKTARDLYMRMRPLQDKHDYRSPRLVKHSGDTAAESGVSWGTKSVGSLER